MVEWVMVAPCMVAWEATGAIIEWVCMDSSRIKENNSHLTLMHLTSLI